MPLKIVRKVKEIIFKDKIYESVSHYQLLRQIQIDIDNSTLPYEVDVFEHGLIIWLDPEGANHILLIEKGYEAPSVNRQAESYQEFIIDQIGGYRFRHVNAKKYVEKFGGKR